MGKRDIIFFMDEIPVHIRVRIRLGVRVLFRVESNSQKRNCKGALVDHYAFILDVLDESSLPLLQLDPCQSIEFREPSCLPQSMQKESSGVVCQLPHYAYTSILQELLNTVYLDVFKKSSSIPNNSVYKSCWEV